MVIFREKRRRICLINMTMSKVWTSMWMVIFSEEFAPRPISDCHNIRKPRTLAVGLGTAHLARLLPSGAQSLFSDMSASRCHQYRLRFNSLKEWSIDASLRNCTSLLCIMSRIYWSTTVTPLYTAFLVITRLVASPCYSHGAVWDCTFSRVGENVHDNCIMGRFRQRTTSTRRRNGLCSRKCVECCHVIVPPSRIACNRSGWSCWWEMTLWIHAVLFA